MYSVDEHPHLPDGCEVGPSLLLWTAVLVATAAPTLALIVWLIRG